MTVQLISHGDFILYGFISLWLFYGDFHCKTDGDTGCVICKICGIAAKLARHRGQKQFLRVCRPDIKLLCQDKQNGGKDNCVQSPIHPALARPHGKSRLTGDKQRGGERRGRGGERKGREREEGGWANEIEIKRKRETTKINHKIHRKQLDAQQLQSQPPSAEILSVFSTLLFLSWSVLAPTLVTHLDEPSTFKWQPA